MKLFKPILISGLLSLCGLLTATELPRGLISLEGDSATNFVISDYDNKGYQLSSSKGKWVFLHFWASWCGPCRKEMPVIYKLQKQLADKPIDFVLINTSEDEDTIFSFLGTVAPDLHSYMDHDGTLTESWAPRGLPTTFFIDPQGRRRYLALGGRPWDEQHYQNFINALFTSK